MRNNRRDGNFRRFRVGSHDGPGRLRGPVPRVEGVGKGRGPGERGGGLGGEILMEREGLAETGDGGRIGLRSGGAGSSAVSGGAQGGGARERRLDGRRRGEGVGNGGEGVNHPAFSR